MYGVPLEDVVAVNKTVDVQNLLPGDMLQLPANCQDASGAHLDSHTMVSPRRAMDHASFIFDGWSGRMIALDCQADHCVFADVQIQVMKQLAD